MGAVVFSGPGSGLPLPDPSREERREVLDELSQLGQEMQVDPVASGPKRQTRADIAAKLKD